MHSEGLTVRDPGWETNKPNPDCLKWRRIARGAGHAANDSHSVIGTMMQPNRGSKVILQFSGAITLNPKP